MNKKLLSIFIAISIFVLGSYLYSSSLKFSSMSECAFCNDEIVDRQKFYEDDLVLALYTHKPVLPGHCLVIPKRHVERYEQLTDEEMLQIGQVIKKVHLAASHVFKTSSYLLLQKNGVEAGQTVPHVHFHYIPRQDGDNSTIMFFFKMYIANVSAPIANSEMEEIVQSLKIAVEL